MESMWSNIFTKPLKFKSFRKFRVEMMNCPVEYKYESTCEDVVKATEVSKTNTCIHSYRTNYNYRSYAKSTRETIKPPMTSSQECVGGTHNPVVPVRVIKTGFQRITGFLHLMAVTGSIWQSDRIYNRSHVYRSL